MNDPRIWFRPKHVGFGWSPHTWEGWAVMALAVAAIMLVGRIVRG